MPRKPFGRQLAQVEADRDRDRRREDERDRRGDDGAEDEVAGAEDALDRVPGGAGQEAEAEVADREARAVEDLVGDRADQDDRGDAGDERDAVEREVAETVAEAPPAEREGAARLDRCRLHEAETTAAVPAFRPRSPPRHHTETIRQPSPHRHQVRHTLSTHGAGRVGDPDAEHLGHSEEERSLEKKDSHLEPRLPHWRSRSLRSARPRPTRAATSTAKGGSLTGAGSSFVVPARLAVDPGGPLGARDQGHLRLRRQRRRHPADHQPHGRLRRQRRAAQRRAVRRLQRLRPDPVGAVGDGDRLQPLGRLDPPQADGPGDREHLPREDQEVERPRDQGGSTGASNIPGTDITVIHRSDGSGTTYNFTEYLTRSARPGSRRSARARRSTGRSASAAAGARASRAC